MTHRNFSLRHRYTQGFSLIELMVSLTIGLVIAIAAGSAYLGSAGAGRMAEAQSRMNEDAQAALNILAQQISMAAANPSQPNRADDYRHNPVFDSTYVGGSVTAYPGTAYTLSFTPATATFAVSPYSIRGCDGTFSNITTATATSALNTSSCASTGTATVADSIAISYEADRYDTVATAGGLPTDCLGSTLTPIITASFPPTLPPTATSGTYTVADNRFYVGTPAGIVTPSLYCKGSSSAAQPLVENVEDMQLTYGTVSTTNAATTATIAGYLSAAEVEALTITPSTANDDFVRWGKVLTVRICVLVRSENPVAPDANAAKYDDCLGNTNVNAPDLRLRRAYWTTVVLRNRRL